MYDVITVGSSTVDAFAKTNFSELIKIMRPEGETDFLAYPTGAKILIEELRFTTGGGATNTAVSLARLGHKVAFLGKLGGDENADFIIKKLKKEKVDIIASKGKGLSGYSMILDSLEHDRTILAYKGANNEFKYKDIPLKKIKTRWLYFSAMMGKSFEALEKLSVFAKKKGIKVAFNPSSYLAKKGKDFLSKILSNTSILILNDEEAKLIVGSGKAEELLIQLSELGPEIVVITMGGKGAAVYDGKFVYIAKPKKIKPVETTGAGDAFASSFLSGIIKKNNIEFAIRLAQANAGSVIQHHGAKNKLLNYKQALDFIRKGNLKIKKKEI